MEASHGTEPRVIRLRDAPDAMELDTTDLLGPLEAQADEIGRLAAGAESFERGARVERDARRRLSDTLKRERSAAEAALAAKDEEIERLEKGLALAEQQKQMVWMQLNESSQRIAVLSRPLWRKVMRRPPKG